MQLDATKLGKCFAVSCALTLAASCLNLSPDGQVFACTECAEPDSGAPDPGTPDAGQPGCNCPLPAPFCEGATRVEAQSARCTGNGGCAYSGVATVCPESCEGSTCKGDPCLGVVCRTPPAPMCVNEQTLKTYAATGSCNGGNCTYATTELSCLCAGNRCVTHLCAGVSCQQPPPAQCLGTSLRTFAPQGNCNAQDGTCVYSAVELSCAQGCKDGQCIQDKCAGVQCTSPPTSSCVDPSHLRTYVASGTCDSSTGRCTYGDSVTACPSGKTCSAGQCLTPPAQCNASNCAGCCEGTTCVVTASQSGSRCGKGGDACGACGPSGPTCNAGGCHSACTAASCNTPPAARCLNDATVELFANPGTCIPSDGGCQYPSSQVTCPSTHTCSAGSCVPNGPPDAGPAISFSSGLDHSCAVRGDGHIWCWGDNSLGQYGNVSIGSTRKPVKTSPSSLAWQKIWSGGLHSCALTAQASPKCWGSNGYGQAGSLDGGQATAGTPEANGGWVAIAPGRESSCAISSASNLWCWGSNNYGRLGNGSTLGISAAVKVAGTGWAKVDVHRWHACAIKTDQTLWCWGKNNEGELGAGYSSQEESTPVQVSGTDWSSVSTGEDFTCATKTDGTLWCWGRNANGRLGYETQYSRHTFPTQVRGTSWKRVSVGASHGCAIKTDNTIWCWGSNVVGQLGSEGCPCIVCLLGPISNCHEPKQVAGNDWADIEVGYDTVCAQRLDKSLWCWGNNGSAQIGDDTNTHRFSPTRVLGL